jgi:hypothetical protein
MVVRCQEIAEETGGDTVDVELDVFSGQPNPHWKPTEDEAAALANRLRELPEAADSAEPPGLGYRGFVVHNPVREFGLPTMLRVYHGITDVTDSEHPVAYADVHGAEGLLIEQAALRGYSTVLGH